MGVGYNTFNLVELDLSSLKLKDENNLFNKDLYPKLTKLNLSRNIFKTFSIFGKLPYLVELNLNYNLFTEIFQKKTKLSFIHNYYILFFIFYKGIKTNYYAKF